MSSSGKACLWYFKPPDLARKREDSLNLLAFLRRSTVYAASTADRQDRKKRTSMKTACTSRIAFLNPRVLMGFALYAAGLVLVFGSMSSAVQAQTTRRWRITGSMATAREFHAATLLPNGQVLVSGGFGSLGNLASAELYDPATGIWTVTGSMATARLEHTATLL